MFMSLQPLVPNRLDDENSALVILDQTLLPNEVKYLALHTNEEICHAIKTLQVRGAPAIGVAAGYGAYLGAKAAPEDSFEAFYNYFQAICADLAAYHLTGGAANNNDISGLELCFFAKLCNGCACLFIDRMFHSNTLLSQALFLFCLIYLKLP